MTAQTQDTAEVRTSIEVAAPPERAFRVFTADFDRWWPRSHHLLPGELAGNGIDPVVGGRIWERSTDGETCTWGVPKTLGAAEAIYWRGVTRYKRTNDHTELPKIAAEFERQHQQTIWAMKASIWRH